MDAAQTYFLIALEKGVSDDQRRRAADRRDQIGDDTIGLYRWFTAPLRQWSRRRAAALRARPVRPVR